MTEICPRSGRIVTQTALARAIYTTRWIAPCPTCGKTASFRMAELRPDGVTYRRRWEEHTRD